jgi:hypothetical protein
MKPLPLAALLTLLASSLTSASAAATNTSTVWVTNTLSMQVTNQAAAAERRARIEAWRAQYAGSNRPASNSLLGDTQGLSSSERRARIRAKLEERRQRASAHAADRPALPPAPATNPPPAAAKAP